jgi:hypothetical protein
MNDLEVYCGKVIDLESLAKKLFLDVILCSNNTEFGAIKFTAIKSGMNKTAYLTYQYIGQLNESQI